jgi:hypothetical protein
MREATHEIPPVPPDAIYEQNRAIQLELMGRINARLSAKYRTDQPRAWEHVGEQEEIIAMLKSVAELLGA